MHHFAWAHVGFLHDGDALMSPESNVEICVDDETFNVPAGALVAFVAHLVARERISEIEDAEPLAVLGVKADQ